MTRNLTSGGGGKKLFTNVQTANFNLTPQQQPDHLKSMSTVSYNPVDTHQIGSKKLYKSKSKNNSLAGMDMVSISDLQKIISKCNNGVHDEQRKKAIELYNRVTRTQKYKDFNLKEFNAGLENSNLEFQQVQNEAE